jgi:hypothetical protein
MGTRRGASALEFALVLVVLVPLVLSSVEFGWYLSLRIAVEHCTRDAARAATQVCNPDNCDALDGGECSSCLSPAGVDPDVVAVDRFVQCWVDTGFPGTASASAIRDGAPGGRYIRVTSNVTYAPVAATSSLPNPIHTTLVMRFADQSY